MTKEPSAVTIIADACEDICNNYCKYPDLYSARYADEDEANARMMEEICDHCPLNRIL
ncbi:MAG: hypothetical protein IIZ83_10095 [Oscillospiraceae bacterium]|nr:hypothetical protein [Oscillospiraceae bacterium]